MIKDGNNTMKVIFATGNENKLREIRQITEDMDIEVVSMKDAGFYTDVEETGTTFEENALCHFFFFLNTNLTNKIVSIRVIRGQYFTLTQ